MKYVAIIVLLSLSIFPPVKAQDFNLNSLNWKDIPPNTFDIPMPPSAAAKRAEIKKEQIRTNPCKYEIDTRIAILKDILTDPDLSDYITRKDTKLILWAWSEALRTNCENQKINYRKTVTDFREILLEGREGDGVDTDNDGRIDTRVSRVASHWGEITMGTYVMGKWAGPPAAIIASLMWNTFSITKGQLIRSYRHLKGDGPPPPAGNYWGEQMNKSIVVESAAAGWANTLPNNKRVDFSSAAEMLEIGELYKALEEDGLLKVIKTFWGRYFTKR